MTKDSIYRKVARGQWEKGLPGVYRFAGTTITWEQEVMAATLWAGEGTLASGRTAAMLHGLEGFESGLIEISTSKRLNAPNQKVIVHRVDCFGTADAARVDGIPATSAARTIVDLAASCGEAELEQALDSALRERLVTLTRMKWQLRQSQGKRGVKTLGRLVAQRQKYGVPQTGLERDFLRLIKSSPLEMPYSQYRIPGIGHVDFFYPEDKLIIETDGYAFHSDPEAFETDRARDQEAARLGLRVVRLTKRDVRDRPGHVIKLITSLKDEVRRAR